ncbi:MAG: DNA transformation protein [Candidatus Azotimanducaceae bacterium]|jgi:DNA transformation protein
MLKESGLHANLKSPVHSELLELKNLGKTSVRWLNAIGIRTRAQLEEKGPVLVYQSVLARGFRANRVLLYALQGALLNKHWNELAPEVKKELLQMAETS